MQKRFRRVIKEKAREIFEAGKFNLELFQYVIDEYFKQKQEKEEKEQKEKDEADAEEKELQPSVSLLSRVFGGQASAKGKMIGWASVALIMIVCALMVYRFAPLGLSLFF